MSPSIETKQDRNVEKNNFKSWSGCWVKSQGLNPVDNVWLVLEGCSVMIVMQPDSAWEEIYP